MQTHAAAEDRDEAILLREFAHRTGNVLAIAVAAVELASRVPRDRGSQLLAEAGGRLRKLGELHRLLARPVLAEADVGADLEALCAAMHSSRPQPAGTLHLDIEPARVDGPTARRLSLVAAELVENAFRHALDGGDGTLQVTLRRAPGALSLVVSNDGAAPGRVATSGTGYGGGLVAELVGRAGGEIVVDHSALGTTVRVEMPVVGRAGDGR